MKFRSGFVTNSSSSSFIIVTVESKELVDTMRLADPAIKSYDDFEDSFIMTDKSVSYSYTDRYVDEYPFSIEEVFNYLLARQFINSNGKDLLKQIPKDSETFSRIKRVGRAIFNNKQDILNDIDKIEVTVRHWGEPGVYRLVNQTGKESDLSSELHKIKSEIARVSGLCVDEIDMDDIAEYLEDKDYSIQDKFVYDKSTGESSITVEIDYGG